MLGTPGRVPGARSDGQVFRRHARIPRPCAGTRQITRPDGQVRHRVMLSDGEFTFVCILANNVEAAQITEGAILEVAVYTCGFMHGKR